MLELIKGTALALRFLLELCALGALGYWGFMTGGTALAKVGLGLGSRGLRRWHGARSWPPRRW